MWFEDGNPGKEMEEVIPASWVQGNSVRWPAKGAAKALKEMHAPSAEWMSFKWIKTKITSGRLLRNTSQQTIGNYLLY